MQNNLPSVSFIIPTYNSEKVLFICLKSIKKQNYPRKKIEIVIVDGGSTDNTIQIAKEFKVDKILENPFVIHPRGRSIGIKDSRTDLILCLDSDNILYGKDWLQKMVKPFRDKSISAVEPLYYVANKNDNIVTKYCSLIGADDPIIVYLGFHERFSYLTNTWTGVSSEQKDKGDYLKVKFNHPSNIPSLGANGFIVRGLVLKGINFDPFYHVDISHRLIKKGYNVWAKVKVGIIHKQEDSITKFFLKKKRRVERRMDFNTTMGYTYSIKTISIMKLLLRAILIFPILIDAVVGFKRKKSWIWFLHPVIFYGEFLLYGYTFVLRKFKKIKTKDYEKI